MTGEMMWRPIPHVFPEASVAPLLDVWRKHTPTIYDYIFSNLKPVTQAFNKTSKLGYPFFSRPESKLETLRPYFMQLLSDGAAVMKDGVITMNVRLQPERRNRDRDFIVATDNRVAPRRATERNRTVSTAIGDRVASRTRLVFNLPVGNLLKQALDSAIHEVLLSNPLFHHDMYNRGGTLPVEGVHVCADIAHFERHTAAVARARGMLMGGLYADITSVFKDVPFLAPDEDWSRFYEINVNRHAGFSDQFASGDSSVAPIQKEILLAIFLEAWEEIFNLSGRPALVELLSGGNKHVRIRNYGDDNSFSGSRKHIDQLMSILGRYLDVQEEDPPKFLGFIYSLDRAKWELHSSSYLSKNFLAERPPFTNFRRFPYFGLLEKRKVYLAHGSPQMPDVIKREIEVLEAEAGLTNDTVIRRAQKEVEQMRREGLRPSTDARVTLEKDYLLSPLERLRLPGYEGLLPGETRPIIKALIGKEHHAKLKF
jgi:hypothetical protein